MLKKLIFTAFCIVASVITASAQWSGYNSVWQNHNNLIVDQAIGNAIMCGAYRKANGGNLPAECTRGKSSSSSQGRSNVSSSSGTKTQPSGSSQFTPVATDNSFQKFADMGSTQEEKQLMLQIANTTKESFERQNAVKGWKNNVAGAMTFFIVTNSTLYNGEEVSDAAMDNLFKSLNSTMGENLAGASNKDKTELYNYLIAYAGLPLVIYAHGAQTGNAAQVEQARKMAGSFVQLILKTEPENLKALLK